MDKVKLDGFGINRTVYRNGVLLDINKGLEMCEYSTEGFNWGYEGKGCAQLGFAILLEHTSLEEAMHLTDAFTAHIIAKLKEQSFSIKLDINKWLEDARNNKLQLVSEYLDWLPVDPNFNHVEPSVGMRVREADKL